MHRANSENVCLFLLFSFARPEHRDPEPSHPNDAEKPRGGRLAAACLFSWSRLGTGPGSGRDWRAGDQVLGSLIRLGVSMIVIGTEEDPEPVDHQSVRQAEYFTLSVIRCSPMGIVGMLFSGCGNCGVQI